MEFRIEQKALKNELRFLQGIVERKPTIPVLSNFTIESVGENTIRMVGTDLDVTIRCEAEAEIIKPGSICVNAKTLFEIVRLLPDESLHFKKLENSWVYLQCGNSKFRLAGVDIEQYPEIPDFKSAPLTIESSVVNRFIDTTGFIISTDQSRFTLSGAKFIVEDGLARMVTTDGYRLGFIEKKIEIAPDERIETLIPKKALLELAKLARESEGKVGFGEDENHIFFEIDGRLLTSRKLSGNFPNYEMVIPKDNDKKVVFDSGEMKQAVDRVAILADERTRRLLFVISNGELRIVAESAEDGEGNEVLPIDYKGEEVSINFNVQFVQEFLNNITGVDFFASEQEHENDGEKVMVKEAGNKPKILFEFRDSNGSTQMCFADETEFDYKYIMMPLRV
ncbi:MAG: DNA polymerase III subunit beta [Pyrinomonadaceae bacterium]